ncbi:MAG: Glu/Leu/Phe/Val dehydrogenase [Lysobacterales bacterium]
MEITPLNCDTNADFAGHEQVVYGHDQRSGLRAVVAIHSTALGPSAGGCRRWSYTSENAAITDALRLSRGMSFKNALAGLPFGGGKAVILAEPGVPASAEEFQAFGRFVQSLNGRYITAEDVGVSTDNMQQVSTQTRFVSGLPQTGLNVGGDPSPWTALGVFLSIQKALGRTDMAGVTVAVQGAGHVGMHLCRLLHGAGATLKVADISELNVGQAVEEFGATKVSVDDILSTSADVLAPCAMGGVINSETVNALNVAMVAGAANNQLATPADGESLQQRGIAFLPDYVINAGGIIAVGLEYLGGATQQQLEERVGQIPDRVERLMAKAREEGVAPGVVADRTAQSLIGMGAADSSSQVA